MTPALQGIKVFDLSRVLAGPWCSMTLADLGAEVIKVEPLTGDDTRSWGPPSEGDISAYFACVNRNKKSITLNLQAPESKPIVAKLAAWADVVLQNYRDGTDKLLGVDYNTLKRINPQLVYCSISGYGRSGPYADKAGYDFVIQAEGGLMSITGESEGMPHKVGVAITDIVTGQNATQAILAALFAREKTGVGQFIDVSLFDSQLQMLSNISSSALFTHNEPRRWGNAHATIVPYQTFIAQDGLGFVLAVGSQKLWRQCCNVLNQPGWIEDPQFATNPQRVQHRATLAGLLADIFIQKPAAHWVALFHQAGVPCGPIHTVQQALHHPVTLARGMTITLDNIPMVASPLHLSETPVHYHSAPPHLGDHTDEVLRLLGEDPQALRRAGVVK